MSNTSGNMIVTFSVEVSVGPWSGDATFDSLHEQASREAEQTLRNIIQKHSDIRLIRVDAVGALIVRKDKS